jgi:CheY-like chemotaxis protein
MTPEERGPAAKVGRILVVEDSASARRLLQEVLLRLGAEPSNLRMAGTVVESLALFSQFRPDVVFVDIDLSTGGPSSVLSPVPAASPQDPKDGAELALRFLARDPGVRVILCSASDPSDPRVAQLMPQGKADFIMKPLLASRVEAVLAHSNAAPRPRRS